MHPYDTPALRARFWAKVDKNGPVVRPELGPCWLWTASRHQFGYGWFGIGSKADGTARRISAHVLAYWLTVGDVPAGTVIRHRCDNPPCCNPAHLLAGTQADNMADKRLRGRLPMGE